MGRRDTLTYFAEHYPNAYGPREIARALDISPSVAQDHINAHYKQKRLIRRPDKKYLYALTNGEIKSMSEILEDATIKNRRRNRKAIIASALAFALLIAIIIS